MKHFKTCFALVLLAAMLLPGEILAKDFPHPDTYAPTISKFQKAKRYYDDPTPVFETWNKKKMTPPEIYEEITFDVEEMKSEWSGIVGFKAPDVVGKIAPDIKPGKYTYEDVQNNPGFKELMWPTLYDRIKPGGPPLGANIPEFEIIPTQQYYWSSPICEATKKNVGKTKLDEKGYIKWQTWESGIPFPRPSGPQKANQILYNWYYRRDKIESNGSNFADSRSFDKNLKEDSRGLMQWIAVACAGRTLFPPYGWYDKNAQARGESWAMSGQVFYPREAAGTMIMNVFYQDPEKLDTSFIYIPSLRRVRKMSTTDTQDPMPLAGLTDWIGDDQNLFTQKLSPKVFPYKVELLEEREYLALSPTADGSMYLTKDNLELRNVKMERRPMYVIQLTQLDPNYVYSKRIFYVDKEFLLMHAGEFYDKRGRLYRSIYARPVFDLPEIGQFGWNLYYTVHDHIDYHTTIYMCLEFTAVYSRDDLLKRLTKGMK